MLYTLKRVVGLWLGAMALCLIMGTTMVYADEKVNINTAPSEILQTLPGIGPALAERIIAYREATPFEEKEDIQKVSGIGEATYNKLEDLITVDDPA
ncbi:competence protein ComEA [Desulfonatronum thiosulfatophilum]|uniref:Competence protein ComEA n=1 Tax=Desulfonatronum thiosulfatophilum TaxID=617002 RepID=A0A1G6BN79_9BACT|nr:ComEA family DNA-binding protein [Desulfonatronum thiosulfatophilum]SDB22100.1 competence protein ComEA [Desulfonatronum thiosulfatophilum]